MSESHRYVNFSSYNHDLAMFLLLLLLYLAILPCNDGKVACKGNSAFNDVFCLFQVRGLASVLGINFDELREKSDRMKKLYDRLQNLL